MASTIIVVCSGLTMWLQESLESALSQTAPTEVMVVDDGSPDAAVSRIAESVKVPTIIRTMRPNGPYPARNLGIRCAREGPILLLDADDRIEPDFCEKVIPLLNCGYDVVGTWVKTFGDTEREYRLPTPRSNKWLQDNQIFITSAFKKELWRQLGGFDESLFALSDWDFWIRAERAGAKFSIVPEFLLHVRRHPDSITNTVVRPNLHEWRRKVLSRYAVD